MSPRKGSEPEAKQKSGSFDRKGKSESFDRLTSVQKPAEPEWWEYRHEMDLTEEEYAATKTEIEQVERSNPWVPLGTSGALTDRPSARRPKWEIPDPTHQFGGGVFGEQHGLALSGIGPRERKVVGMDVEPTLGQRVVGSEGQPFATMGIGTVMWVGGEGGGGEGMCGVRWDVEQHSGREPMGYSCGRGGAFHLEECIAEDDLVGRRYLAEEEPRMFGRGLGLFSGGATKNAMLLARTHPPPGGHARWGAGAGGEPHHPPSNPSPGAETPMGSTIAPHARSRSPSLQPSSVHSSPLARSSVHSSPLARSKQWASPSARSRGHMADLLGGRRWNATPSPLHGPPEHAGKEGVGGAEAKHVLLNLFVRFAKGMVRKRFHGYDKRSLEVQKIESLSLEELTLILQVINEAMEWPFYPDVVTAADVASQYATFAARSDPMANGELDFDRFLECLESITLLIGLPFSRVVHVARMYVDGKRPNMPKTKRTQRYTAFLTQRYDDKKDNSGKLGEQSESLWDHPRPLPPRHKSLFQRISHAHGLFRGIHLPVGGAVPKGSGEHPPPKDGPPRTSPLHAFTSLRNEHSPMNQTDNRPRTSGTSGVFALGPAGTFDSLASGSTMAYASPSTTPQGGFFPSSPRSRGRQSSTFIPKASSFDTFNPKASSFDGMLGLGPPGTKRRPPRVLSPPGTHPLKPASSAMVSRIPLVGTTFLAHDLQFVEKKNKLVERRRKAMEGNKKVFDDKMSQIHENERRDIQLYKEWSRVFIITTEVNPWYKGREVRFWSPARSGAELAKRTLQEAHRIMNVPHGSPLHIKFNVVARSHLIAGAQPKWLELDEETLTHARVVPGGGKNDPGTFLKCIRTEDREEIKNKSRKIWSKMSKVVKEGAMTKRSIDLTGLTAATNWSMMKTLKTGNSDWIDGVASRAKLKATITQLGESFRREKESTKEPPRPLDRSVERSIERAVSGDGSYASEDVGGLTSTLSNLIWNARFMAVSKAPIRYTAGGGEASEISFLVTTAIGTCRSDVECCAAVVEPVAAAMPMWVVLTSEDMTAQLMAAQSPRRDSPLGRHTASLDTIGIDDEEDGRAAGGGGQVLIGMESVETLGVTAEGSAMEEEPSINVGDGERHAAAGLVPTVQRGRGGGEAGGEGGGEPEEDQEVVYVVPGGQLPSTLKKESPRFRKAPSGAAGASVDDVFGADKEKLLHFTAADWESWNADDNAHLLLDEDWWGQHQVEGKAVMIRFCWSKSSGPDLGNEPWVKVAEIIEDLGAAAVVFVLPDNWAYIPDMVMESDEEARDIEIPVCFVSCKDGRHLALSVTDQKTLHIRCAELKALELNDEFAETKAPF